MKRIVVGVDGSEQSADALHWAVAEARAHGSQVEAVCAYEYTPAWYAYAYAGEAAIAGADLGDTFDEAAEQAAREHAERLVQQMVRALGDTGGVRVKPMAVEGHRPAEVLVDRSSSADLLVVGSRGRGGFTGLLLGSVSQQCAQHAKCPVVILPHLRG